jgi:hypothetical protein
MTPQEQRSFGLNKPVQNNVQLSQNAKQPLGAYSGTGLPVKAEQIKPSLCRSELNDAQPRHHRQVEPQYV